VCPLEKKYGAMYHHPTTMKWTIEENVSSQAALPPLCTGRARLPVGEAILAIDVRAVACFDRASMRPIDECSVL
jgi:hypothetical protein